MKNKLTIKASNALKDIVRAYTLHGPGHVVKHNKGMYFLYAAKNKNSYRDWAIMVAMDGARSEIILDCNINNLGLGAAKKHGYDTTSMRKTVRKKK